MAPRFPYEDVRDGLGQNALTCSPDLKCWLKGTLILGSYLDLKDPVYQSATVGPHGQVSPPATPHLDQTSAREPCITRTFKNLASTRDRGKFCLNFYFVFLLISSWYSVPVSELIVLEQ